MFYIKEQKNIIGMLFPDAEEYNLILESVGNFAEKEILSTAKNIDQEEIFPKQNLEKVAKQGSFAMPFPAQYYGLGLPFPVYIAALEMLARACANTALAVSIQGMVCEGIRLFRDEKQKNRFLKEKGLVEGRNLAAFALTEPCCGSDARAIQTKAKLSGNTYVINGTKTLITSPGEADFILLFARADEGISAFLVPRETPGFNVAKVIPKLGLKGINCRKCTLRTAR